MSFVDNKDRKKVVVILDSLAFGFNPAPYLFKSPATVITLTEAIQIKITKI